MILLHMPNNPPPPTTTQTQSPPRLLLRHSFEKLRSAQVATIHCSAQTSATHIMQKLSQVSGSDLTPLLLHFSPIPPSSDLPLPSFLLLRTSLSVEVSRSSLTSISLPLLLSFPFHPSPFLLFSSFPLLLSSSLPFSPGVYGDLNQHGACLPTERL